MKHLNCEKQKGELNSQYGTVWYFNPSTLQSRKFSKDEKIPDGWIKGRKILKSKQFEKCKKHITEYEKHPKLCEYCNQPIPFEKRFLKTCCKEHGKLLNKQSNHATNLKRHSTGGKRHGSGRGKKGWYKGIWCDSSWELALVIYWLDHKIKFERYHGYFEYVFENKKHKYYPDFIHPDGSFTEVKGYSSKQWIAKLNAFPKNLKLSILGKKEIIPIIEYVEKTYGKDFIKMYEPLSSNGQDHCFSSSR